MLHVIGCITQQHDIGLVLIAAPLCFFACFTAMSMIGRAHAAKGNARRLWIVAAGFLTGCGAWATHFVWMLAYKSSLPMGFDVHLIVISAAAAIMLCGIGYWLALEGPGPFAATIVMGTAVGAMHYIGMASVQIQADAIWSPGYVMASIAIGTLLIYPGMVLAASGTSWRMQLGATALITLGIASLHFTGMSAVTYFPDPLVSLHETTIDTPVMAISIAAAVFSIVILGLAGSLIDNRLASQAIREAQRLRSYVEELEAAKRQLLIAKCQAEAGSRAKSNFLSNMSHELRTPLNAILGFSQMICGDVCGLLAPAKSADYARDIKKSGEHLLKLINDMLDLAKIEAGKLELDERALSLDDVANRAMGFVKPQAAAKQVHLHSDIEFGGTLRGDERSVTQILTNLLSNAVKFSRQGGAVRIFASADQAGLMLGVEDNGIGMSPEGLKTALEPFGQVTAMETIEGRGTGLGLPLVKSLVEAHGGQFFLESELNLGTRAWALFPAERLQKRLLAA